MGLVRFHEFHRLPEVLLSSPHQKSLHCLQIDFEAQVSLHRIASPAKADLQTLFVHRSSSSLLHSRLQKTLQSTLFVELAEDNVSLLVRPFEEVKLLVEFSEVIVSAVSSEDLVDHSSVEKQADNQPHFHEELLVVNQVVLLFEDYFVDVFVLFEAGEIEGLQEVRRHSNVELLGEYSQVALHVDQGDGDEIHSFLLSHQQLGISLVVCFIQHHLA